MIKYILGLMASVTLFVSVGSVEAAPIHDAARTGDLASVQQELRNGVDVNEAHQYGYTALIWAAMYGHTAIVERLLQVSGINANYVNKYGRTALMSAARNGHTDTVKLLIDHGADVNHADNDGTTALDVVRTDEIKQIIQDYIQQQRRLSNTKSARK